MFIADFHIHSKYSRACSKKLTLPNISSFCQIKGVDLIATADFTHPIWFNEISYKLKEENKGIYVLKKEYEHESQFIVPKSCKTKTRFILSTEISLIYKKNSKVRKIHHVILSPNIETCAKINKTLGEIGNLRSDGRPILGLDSKLLLKILLEISPDIELIPAHIWTPWFAIFGSKSGFDSVEECFDDLSEHIHALETGLSSDPKMNWQVGRNAPYMLISNSDAHSLEKIGREATIFDTEISYPAILNALRKDHEKIIGTVEFFPEEGKYHLDGLMNENLSLTPAESKKYNLKSPKTGKNLTIGVAHRVFDLSDKNEGEKPKTARPYYSTIPLLEIISEILQTGVQSKKVKQKYFETISALGSELYILNTTPINEIKKTDEILALAISNMRKGKVNIKAGYDGVYGSIKTLDPTTDLNKNQTELFKF